MESLFVRNNNAASTKRSRYSPDVTKICSRCDSELTNDNMICNGCKLKYCIRCTELTNAAYSCIKNGDLGDFQWNCRACKAVVPTLEHINNVLGDMQKKQEVRLEHIENRLDTMEISTQKQIKMCSKEIKRELSIEMKEEVKTKISEELLEDVNKMVDERSREWNNRRSRELNVVIFNLEEGTRTTGEENKEEDKLQLKSIAEALGIEDLEISNLFRLGKYQNGKTRGLKAILKDRRQRNALLEIAKQIKLKVIEKHKKVIITRDLTPLQRDEFKAKRVKQNRHQEVNNEEQLMHIDPAPDLSPIRSQRSNSSEINQSRENIIDSVIENAYMSATVNEDVTIIGGVDLTQQNQLVEHTVEIQHGTPANEQQEPVIQPISPDVQRY